MKLEETMIIALRLEAIAIRLKTIAIRLDLGWMEAIAIRLEAFGGHR